MLVISQNNTARDIRMVELKNISIGSGTTAALTDLSAVAGAGETLLLYGATPETRHALINAVMGLTPVSKGYLTIDGEIVDAASARYFRRQMAFIPSDTTLPYATLRGMAEAARKLQANRGRQDADKELFEIWAGAGIERDCYDRPWNDVGQEIKRTAMTGVALWLHKPIILAEETTTPSMSLLLKKAAAGGATIIATAAGMDTDCRFDKYVNLDKTRQ